MPQTDPFPSGITPEKWARIEVVFDAAMNSDTLHRGALLDGLCAGETALRREVEALIAAQEASPGLLYRLIGVALEEIGIAPDSSPPAGEFLGDERFEVRRKLGGGAYGAVYEVFDRNQEGVVALKTLYRADAFELQRFKREFRSLADIVHPNLVSFYELFLDDERWFFTMELVEGRNFLEYVREDPEFRLRSVAGQLAAGVCALHDAGKLHGDLKPSNVLVATGGRVVIVDFGLVSEVGGEPRHLAFGGTPAYMAPEQLAGQPPTAASDWYSVGVMLFEALTGCRPESGTPSDIDTPGNDFASLSRALLSEDSSRRPSGGEVLRRLAMFVAPAPGVIPFVGRENALAIMRDAQQQLATGDSPIVFVTGAAGVGKTSLVSRHLGEVRQDKDALVCGGRCYQQESVPFGALDEMVDVLAVRLDELPRNESRRLFEGCGTAAARLFPVLRRFGTEAGQSGIGSQELRQAAFSSFRRLLAAVAERTPLTIHLDDLHWARAHDLRLLTEILRPPAIPRLFLIASWRSDCAGDLLVDWENEITGRRPVGRIALGGLSPEEANHLASLLVPGAPAGHREALVSQSQGNPFLLTRMALDAFSRDGVPPKMSVSADIMIQTVVGTLPEAAIRLLEMISIAGQPVPSHIAWKACGGAGSVHYALRAMRALRLVTLRNGKHGQETDTYHDLVRQSMERALQSPARAERHLRLALEWESSGFAPAESLAVHFREGGHRPKAFTWSKAAAEAAARGLAFEGAVRWYQAALEFATEAAPEIRELRTRLADALSSAGRGAEAAALYLQCAGAAADAQSVDLRRRAANQLLVSGHMPEGLLLLDDVLRQIGIRPANNVLGTVLGLLLDRLRILLRERYPAFRGPVSIRDLARADICWSAAQGLGMVDPLRAARFHSRHLLLVLRCGDPCRLARARAIEAPYGALLAGRAIWRSKSLQARAAEAARNCGTPYADALLRLAGGITALLQGRWQDARGMLREAETNLRQRCSGVAWELATARLMRCVSMFFLGEVRDLCLLLPELLVNARERGDRYESTDLRIRIGHVLHLASDDPSAALDEVEDAIASWGREGFYLQHWWALIAKCEIHLYAGDSAAAWQGIRNQWGRLRRSLLLNVQYIRIESLHHRGAATLSLAANSGDRRLLATAEADARRIERERTAWGDPLAALIRAGAACIAGNRQTSLRFLHAAEQGFVASEMALYTAATRRRIGQLSSGKEGAALVREADEWMQSQSIRNAARMTGMLAPGFNEGTDWMASAVSGR